ncbi:MAG TPA: hypothetical protein VK469_24375 [Candidatus Kapabacteria bacterium]|nr:hypothetical protein [Candidatus Kapabacteria bacterium]
MHTTIEAVYNNGEFLLEEIPRVKKARVLITFMQEINDDVNGKIKFPTKKLGRIKNIGREGDLWITKLAGLITQKEAEELTKIINAGCEQIDNEW